MERLVKLPCWIGDTIWRPENRKGKRIITPHVIERIELGQSRVTLCFGWKHCAYECVDTTAIGKTIFLTREAAKAAVAAGERETDDAGGKPPAYTGEEETDERNAEDSVPYKAEEDGGCS